MFKYVIALSLCLLVSRAALASYPTGGWTGDWRPEIRPEGCSLETNFVDVTAEMNPNIEPSEYVTNDPFRLYFSVQEEWSNAGGRKFSKGTLFLWLQPRVWENIADNQKDILTVTVNGIDLEQHHPAASPNLTFFFLVGESARAIYQDLIVDREVEVLLKTEGGKVFRRNIPLSNGRPGRFQAWAKMFEACQSDRAR